MKSHSVESLITERLKSLPSKVIDEAFEKPFKENPVAKQEYMDQYPRDLTLCVSRVPFDANQFTILQSLLVKMPHLKIEGHIIGESHCIQISGGSWSFGEVLSCAPKFECDDYHKYELDQITDHKFDPPSDLDFLGYNIETNVIVGSMAADIAGRTRREIADLPLNLIHYFPDKDPHGPFDSVTALGVDITNFDDSMHIAWKSLHAYPNVNGIVITKSQIKIG